MNILLKKIILKNFKSFPELTIEFGKTTRISGRNGSGKTTVADAFNWCLFGKSADGRIIDVAPLNELGQKTEEREHSVSVILSENTTQLGANEYEFKRVQVDKKGGAISSRYYINGHEKLKKEFDAEIAKLCPEKKFKAITNPAYFPNLKWNEQRDELLGLVKVDELELPIEYKETLNQLKKEATSLSERRAELKKQSATLKKSIDEDNAHLVVLQGQNKEYSIDFSALETELAGKQAKLAELTEAGKAAQARLKKKYDLENELQAAIHEQKLRANKEYYEKVDAKSKLNQEYERTRLQIPNLKQQIEKTKKEIAEKEQELDKMRSEFKETQSQKLEFSDGDFKCPTCGREFDYDKIEEIKELSLKRFNDNKLLKLNKLNETGVSIKNQIKQKTLELSTSENLLKEVEKQVGELEKNPLLSAELSPITDFPPTSQITELQRQIDEYSNNQDTDNKSEISVLTAEISAINQRLGTRQIIVDNNKKIDDIYKSISEKTAELQKTEQQQDYYAELQKAYTAGVEREVNQCFKMVSFKLFAQQVNGEIVETCVATHNGIPYPELNTAMQINCGLDIINTICKFNNLYAPIFIDGAESINEIMETESQQIRLVVSNEECLTIKTN